MKRLSIGALGAMGAVLLVGTAPAETMRKLTGGQIRAKISGMEITDEVHWSEAYSRDGTVRSQSMGLVRLGKWLVRKDELCLEFRDHKSDGCYEVWLSGNKIELRPTGLGMALEGILQRISNPR